MKKLFIFLAALILGTSAVWAQSPDVHVFTFRPKATGSFTLRLSAYDATNANPISLFVDWGDGQKVVCQVRSSSYEPATSITGNVVGGKDVNVYGKNLTAIYIDKEILGMRATSDAYYLYVVQYYHRNLSAPFLEAFFQTLRDRKNMVREGRFYASIKGYSYYPEIFNTNPYIALDKKWRICIKNPNSTTWDDDVDSFYAYEGASWMADRYEANVNILPNPNQTITIKAGIRDYPTDPWFLDGNGTTNIHIDWGDGKPVAYSVNNALELSQASTISKYYTGGQIKIYSSLLSVISVNTIQGIISFQRTTNLREVDLNNASANVLYLDGNTYLKKLYLSDAFGSIHSVPWDYSKLTRLTHLFLKGRTSLEKLSLPSSIEYVFLNGCTKLKPANITGLNNATKLWYLGAHNMGLTACELDDLFRKLPSTHPSNAYVEVHDANPDYTTPNDYEGANNTLATNKTWPVKKYEGGAYSNLIGNGYGCGYASPISGSPVITLKVSGAKVRMDLLGSVINTDDPVTPVWIENNTGRYIKKLIKKSGSGWSGFFNVDVLNSTMKIHGRVSGLDLRNQSGVSSVTASTNHSVINRFYTFGTNMDACAMDNLYKSLPTRTASSDAKIFVKSGSIITPGFLTSNSSIAKNKKWVTCDLDFTPMSGDGTGCKTGLSDVEAARFLSVSPNPASDKVVIQLADGMTAQQVQLVDLTGKVMYQAPVTDRIFTIDLSGYTKGVYLLRVGEVARRLVVQ